LAAKRFSIGPSPWFACNISGARRSKVPDSKKYRTVFQIQLGFRKISGIIFFEAFSGGLAAMEQRGRNFSTLEKMCLERAKAAEKEMKYWLAEAEEWERLKNACSPFDVAATQLDCFLELTNR
jgi:hypothetical protein